MIADGGRKPRVTDADLLAVFRSSNDPVLSTAEVADAVPIKRRGTLKRLQSLKADGRLDSKKIGGRNTVWWVPRGDSQEPQERRESAATPSPTTGDQQAEAAEPTPTSSSDASDAAADCSPTAAVDRVAAEQWEDDARLESRKAAAVAVLEYAREHGSVSKAEAKEEVEPEHPVEEQSSRTWYRQTVRPVLKEVGTYSDSKRAWIVELDQ